MNDSKFWKAHERFLEAPDEHDGEEEKCWMCDQALYGEFKLIPTMWKKVKVCECCFEQEESP